MSETKQSDIETYFQTICNLAHLSATITDLQVLLNESLQLCLQELPLEGGVVWLRNNQQDMFTPATSCLPKGYSTSAIAEDHELLQRVVEQGFLILEADIAEPLIQLPDGMDVMIIPIGNEDGVLGYIGYVANSLTLARMSLLLKASADVLSAPTLVAWLSRQQAESDDVASTLFQFAGELRTQSSLEDILGTLNNLALRVFNCDWSGVYIWVDKNEETEGIFKPVQIMNRVGTLPVDEEPSLSLNDNPILEMVINDPDLKSLRDLHEQPNVLPVYHHRHALHGVVLLPILHEQKPMGLLTLGYFAPLVPFSSRLTDLAHGLARMVGVALERTLARQEQ